jgi:hypothetical protein
MDWDHTLQELKKKKKDRLMSTDEKNTEEKLGEEKRNGLCLNVKELTLHWSRNIEGKK